MSLVYLITNKYSGKQYVGKTSLSLTERWFKHLRDAKSGLILVSVNQNKQRSSYLPREEGKITLIMASDILKKKGLPSRLAPKVA